MIARGRPALALRLSIARTARDGSALVPALLQVAEGQPQPDEVVDQVRAVLSEAWPINCHLAAAEALARARAQGGAEAIVGCIARHEVRPRAAGLLATLAPLGGRIGLVLAVSLMEGGPQDVRDAVAEAMDAGRIEPFAPEAAEAARRVLNGLYADGDARLVRSLDRARAGLDRMDGAERNAPDAAPDTDGLSRRLRDARVSRDEAGMRFALAEVSAGKAYPPEVSNEVRRIMEGASLATLRNAAAIALADIGDPRAAGWIRDLIGSPAVARNSATLLYALGELKAPISLTNVVHVAGHGSFEAVGEALGFVERGDLLPYGTEEMAEARATLARLTTAEDAGQARSAEALLEILETHEGLRGGAGGP